MQKLNIEPTYRVVLEETDTFHVMLVGVGGNGSALGLALGRLAYHAKTLGKTVHLTFVDPDIVEEKNIGRQHFCPAEIGHNKAESLALRLNVAFGLGVTAVADSFTWEMTRGWGSDYGSTQNRLLIGAVDNHLARRELATAVEFHQGRVWCLDMGNEYDSGQILIGNLTHEAPKFSEMGLCSGFPSPYVQEPDLLEPDPMPTPSCAERASRGEQSLMVNTMAGAIAVRYCIQFILARRLVAKAINFSLKPFTVKRL